MIYFTISLPISTLGALVAALCLVHLGGIALYTAQDMLRRVVIKCLPARHGYRIQYICHRVEAELTADNSFAYALYSAFYSYPYMIAATATLEYIYPSLPVPVPALSAGALSATVFVGRWVYYLFSDACEERYWLDVGLPWARLGREVPETVAGLRTEKLDLIRRRREERDKVAASTAPLLVKPRVELDLLERENAIMGYHIGLFFRAFLPDFLEALGRELSAR